MNYPSLAAFLVLAAAPLLPAADCASYEMLHTFADAPRVEDQGSSFAHRLPPVFGADGTAYFVFIGGGESGAGAIMKLAPSGELSTLVHFSGSGGPAPGDLPRAGLTFGPDGALYGFTRSGSNVTLPNGTYSGLGVFFRCTTAGVYTVLYTRPVTSSHTLSGPLLLGSDDNFYGLTQDGGPSGNGTIFRMTPAGAFTQLATFTGTSAALGALEGSAPSGALVERSDGGTPYLYGTVANSGTGAANHGKVFKFALPAAAATSVTPVTVVQFAQNIAPFGSRPASGLMLAPDGTLYGSTDNSNAGSANSVIYKIDPAGNYGLVYNVSAGTGTLAASGAHSTPVLRPDGFLYFTTRGNAGSLMRVRPDGSGAQMLFSYSGTTPPPGGRWNLWSPGQLAVRPTDNLLMGLSGQGGLVSSGPYAGRITYGSLFTFDTASLGHRVIKDFHQHTSPDAPATPRGSMIEEGEYYYGATNGGGTGLANSDGTGALYRMHKVTRAMETLYSFDSATAGNPGIWPTGTLRADVGPIAGRRYLYGTCDGGTTTSSGGSVWRYDLTDGTITALVQFTFSAALTLGPTVLRGDTPAGQLENGGDGFLYGVTADDGVPGTGDVSRGSIYRVRLSDGAGQTIHSFNGNTGTFSFGAATIRGIHPLSGLTAARLYGDPAQPIVLYGTTSGNSTGPGANSFGTVFYISTGPTPVFQHLLYFRGDSTVTPGSLPKGKLLAHGSGAQFALYGTTESGGLDSVRNDGTVWRYAHTASGGSFIMLAAFDYFAAGFKGYGPREGVVRGGDGRLYGTLGRSSEALNTPYQRQGAIFRVDSLTAAAQIPLEVASFTGPSSFGAVPGINSAYGGNNQGIPLINTSDGHLLGATQGGGLGDGVIFRVKIGSEVQTLPPINVTTTGATLQANVSVNNETASLRWTWWPSSNPAATATATTAAITTSGTYGHLLTGLTTGIGYTYRCEVVSCAGEMFRDGGLQSFTTTATSVYAQWKQTHFVANATNPAISGDSADPDADGIPNLLEFMTDSIPTAKSPPPLTLAKGDAGEFTNFTVSGYPAAIFTYWRRTNADTGMQLALQYSNDLLTWQTILTGPAALDPYALPPFYHDQAFEWDIGDNGPIQVFNCRAEACAWFGYSMLHGSPKRSFRLKATR
jgi:uncharacterized repeat protein (TIGR03803 family)